MRAGRIKADLSAARRRGKKLVRPILSTGDQIEHTRRMINPVRKAYQVWSHFME